MGLTEKDLRDAHSQVAAMVPQDYELDAMAVLKGHLVTEQNFEIFFEHVLPGPKALEKARLTFHQKFHLYKAFNPDNKHGWLWGAINKLNNLRNDVGHNLKSDDFKIKKDELVNFIYDQNPWKGLNSDDGNWGDLRNSLNIIHIHQIHIKKDYSA
ncbi:MAG: hypothetical protein CMI09_05535 [Oceanospirillaceae bacterium]|nr:hypothetical protein [Oceanospirillaceae bacterium]|tara:strand:- start:911 stop:1375 length:465 start_codon:yes stop_codon:yes gene_type:complete